MNLGVPGKEIEGYIQTSGGIEVKTRRINNIELNIKKKSRKKYNQSQIDLIISYKGTGKTNISKTKKLLELNHHLKISPMIIKKIWNNLY